MINGQEIRSAVEKIRDRIRTGLKEKQLELELEEDMHEVWASTGMKRLPHVSARLANPLPDTPVSPVLKLSGLPELLRTHYMNHRQSFF